MFTRPVILLVDDEPTALARLLDALSRRFGADYRIIAHLSAAAALDQIATLKAEGGPLALVITDQWTPEMTGLELLARARALEPAAKRALLIAWGDRRVAPTILSGCAFGELDNYLLKPWSPPEVHLYPPVSEFLAERMTAYGPRMELAGERRRGRFETSMAGVFAVGDARSGSVKRVASAVGEGAAAVHDVHEYLAHTR